MAADRAGLRLPWMAAGCLAGNLCVHQLPALPNASIAIPLALSALLASMTRASAFVVAAIVAFVWTSLVAADRLAARLPPSASGHDFTVTGWVDDLPDVEPGRAVFGFRVAEAASEAVPERVRLTWYEPPAPVVAGASLTLVVRLRSPRGLANPGGFDYERWLLLSGYGATGYVRSGQAAAGRLGGPAARVARWRGAIARRISGAGLSADAAALIGALTVGDRTAFDERHWRLLRATGTSHLVAISGMHIGLVAALVFWLARSLCVRLLPQRLADYDVETASAASAVAALGYSALAGFAVPTERAVVMVSVALAMAVSRRTVSAFDGLAAALLIVLALNPLAPLGASFWLSFAAVGLLLLIAGRRSARGASAGVRARLARWLSVFSRMQWTIAVGMVPLAAWWFGGLALLSPLVNLVAIPLFSFCLVPLALLATAVAATTGQTILLTAAGTVADAVWSVLERVDEVPWAVVGLPGLSLGHALVGAAAVVAVVRWHPLPGRRLAWLALAPVLLPAHPRIAAGSADVLMLDVGHGLAVLIETAGHRLLYDAGPVSRTGFDAGTEIVLPAIRARGNRPLDMLILSHADSDHAGGAGAVVAAFPGLEVLSGPDVEGFGRRRCIAGQHWIWDGIEFRIVHPEPGFDGLGNESSCVLRVSSRRHALLVTGDIESRAERALVAAGGIDADVVTVPHHGSATSSTAAFVAAVSPQYALVSAAFESRWGFPRPDVRQRWQSRGSRVVVTGDAGAIRVSLGEADVVVESQRDGRPRYWQPKPASALRE